MYGIFAIPVWLILTLASIVFVPRLRTSLPHFVALFVAYAGTAAGFRGDPLNLAVVVLTTSGPMLAWYVAVTKIDRLGRLLGCRATAPRA